MVGLGREARGEECDTGINDFIFEELLVHQGYDRMRPPTVQYLSCDRIAGTEVRGGHDV